MAKRTKRKTNVKGRSKTEGQYMRLPYVMANSDAFRSLSGPAVKVWIELRSRFNGSNNGRVSLSLREAASLLGMSQTTAQRAFRELEQKGFVVRRMSGSWYGRKAAEFILNDCPYDGHPPTRDWQRWRPKNNSSVPRRTANRACAPPEYRDSKILVHPSSRQGCSKASDGAA
ncbi:MAG: helix-turn-helix domain-containing protein [Pseudomonadota bacterium]|nr:helix-turn-helix domain-containing protein [Pseudomonadota bacterium]